MAGYIVSLDSERSLEMYTRSGMYATKMSTPSKSGWKIHHEGTWADYCTMQPGDNIYFFIKRKIYGIGELVVIDGSCRLRNYPEANVPQPYAYDTVRSSLLWDESDSSVNQRWVCFFKPAPAFFRKGIDMDDVLASNPSKFRMLRAFWKLSFVKIDDEENQALKDVILKSNEEHIGDESHNGKFSTRYEAEHQRVREHTAGSSEYSFSSEHILSSCAEGDWLRHEMALEAGLLFQLSEREPNTVDVFGQWDYLSHQVVASPFKPIDYMDKMDVFGYAYVPGYRPTISRYLVAEIKKGTAGCGDIDQLLKYVDWVTSEYAFGNYSMIKAFLVAYEFPQEVINHAVEKGRRNYTIGRRPARSDEWNALSLVKYAYNSDEDALSFQLVT